MRTFYTSDLHFGHGNIIKYCKRPYKTIEEMDRKLIKRLNSRIKTDDMVIHAGDFCFRNSSGGKPGEGLRHKPNYYIDQLNGHWVFLDGNHDCLSKETRVLTKNGFKYYSELNIGDKVASFNFDTRKTEYKPIINKTESLIDKVYNLKTRTCELVCSGRHKLYSVGYNQKRNNIKKINKKEAKELWDRKSHIILLSSCISGNKNYNINETLLKLLAWILTDGGINSSIKIYQSKVKYIKEIKLLLKKLGVKYTLNFRNREIKYILGKKIKSSLPQGIFSISAKDSRVLLNKLRIKSKQLPKWITSLSDSQMYVFMREIVKGDGTFHKQGTNSIWGVKGFLESLMGVFITHNIDCNLVLNKQRGYYLCVHKKRKGSEFGIRQVEPSKRQITNSPQMMWDITVKDNNNFFIELNGKPLLVGNSNNSLKTSITSLVLRLDGRLINVIHNPKHFNFNYSINFVGHIHKDWKFKKIYHNKYAINIGIDVWGYYPRTYDEIMREFNKWVKLEND